MKKPFAFLAAALALSLTARAMETQYMPLYYRIGNGTVMENDGRITTTSSTGAVYKDSPSAQLPASATLTASVPTGQKFSKWWYWYNTDLRTSVTNTTGVTSTTYTWSFNADIQSKIAAALRKEVHFVADYDYINYALYFNGNGNKSDGSSADVWQRDATYEVRYALPAVPFTKTGYTFSHWQNAAGATFANGQTVSGAELGVTQDGELFRLYAQWTPNTYQVHFDSNGGTGSMSDQSFTYDVEQALTPNAFTRANYRFIGWSETQGGAVQYDDGASVKNLTAEANGVKTLYAVWYLTHNIAFDGHGATSGEMAVQGFVDATELLNANAYERTGYTYVGWATNETEAAVLKVTFEDQVQPTGYLPNQGETNWLYAVWQPNKYTVVFNGNGGIWDNEGTYTNSQDFVYDGEQNLAPKTYSRSNWTLQGWSVSQDATAPEYGNNEIVSNLTAEANGVVTLYAVWKSQMSDLSKAMHCYRLKWIEDAAMGVDPSWTTTQEEGYASSGSAVQGVPSKTMYAAASKGVLSFYWKPGENTTLKCFVAGMEGSSFTNLTGTAGQWERVSFRTEDVFGDYTGNLCFKVTIGTVLIDQMTWDPDGAYYVAYDAAGGEGEMAAQALLVNESDVLVANAFVCTGYTFGGWLYGERIFEDRATVYNLTNEQGATVTLSAKWEPIAYTVRFDSNGGAGEMADQAMTYDVDANLSANTFTRDGYTYQGWALSSDATAAAYADGASVRNLASLAGEVVTLYAVWSKNPDPASGGGADGGGSSSGGVQPVDYDSQLFPSDDIGAFTARSAATYTGWLRTATGEIAGQIKVKTGAVKSSGAEAKVTITITPLSGKKRTYKTTVKAGGNPSDAFGMIYGGLGLTGTFGEYMVEAVKDFSKAKTSAERALLDAMPKGVWTLAFDTGAGYAAFSVTVAKKGKAKVSGVLPTGASVNITAQGVLGESAFAVPVVQVKRGIGFVFWLEGGVASVRSLATQDWSLAAAEALRPVADGLYALSFTMPAYEAYLTAVDGFDVTPRSDRSLSIANGKWKALKSVGKVALSREGQAYVKYNPEKEAPVNLAALKLSCAVKTGLVKGSFKLYRLDGAKLKRDTVKVVGATLGGAFYGSGSIKKAGSFPIRLAP